MNGWQPISRRSFLQHGTPLAGAVLAPYVMPSGVLAAPGRAGANERIGLAIIGAGRRAHQLLGDMANAPGIPGRCQVVAVSDVWPQKCHEYVKGYEEKVLKKTGGNYAIHQDYRKVLESRDVDAVLVATPEHWRALICIHACQALKDVYAEKPLCLTVHEGRAIVEAARKHQRVFQTGTQQRSIQRNRQAAELIRNGRLGKVHTVICQNWGSSRPYADFKLPVEPIPEGLDWDKWCGPTVPVPFSMRVYLTYNNPGWHNIQTYSGGWLANAGSHALDMVQWALGADDSGPVEVWAESRSFQAKVTLRYADGALVKLEQTGDADTRLAKEPSLQLASAFGAIFHGDKGLLVMHRGRFNTKPTSISQEPIRDSDIHLYKSDNHFQNWIDCMRSRRQPAADVEIGHRTCTVCHLANIARWTGRRLRWDPKQELFPDDKEANALLQRTQRAPYQLPKII